MIFLMGERIMIHGNSYGSFKEIPKAVIDQLSKNNVIFKVSIRCSWEKMGQFVSSFNKSFKNYSFHGNKPLVLEEPPPIEEPEPEPIE